MSEKTKAFALLGLKARDRVTGFVGVVESLSFDLYGYVQATLRAEAKPDVGPEDKWVSALFWFDIKRLEILNQVPVMSVPDFENVPGPANKPRR